MEKAHVYPLPISAAPIGPPCEMAPNWYHLVGSRLYTAREIRDSGIYLVQPVCVTFKPRYRTRRPVVLVDPLKAAIKIYTEFSIRARLRYFFFFLFSFVRSSARLVAEL